MSFLPTSSGSRPRLACEIFSEGVVAARSPEPAVQLSATARAGIAPGAMMPSLKPGNVVDRVAVIAAVRRALEGTGARPNARNADLTLVIPDAAARMLLLDFDALPTRLSEALSLVRFRLKKMVPFDADDAMVSYQVMSTSRSMVRVLAVAMPRDVLREYESVVREAGFEPGAVLPSTLAVLAALDETEGAALVVNAHAAGVTTAIVRGGVVLLHRSVELTEMPAAVPAPLPAALFETERDGLLPLVDRDTTEAEWAAQQPLPAFGRNPYADQLAAEVPTQDQDGMTALPTPLLALQTHIYSAPEQKPVAARGIDMYAGEASPVSRSPYGSSMLQQELDAQLHNAPYVAPSAAEAFGPAADYEGHDDLEALRTFAVEADPPVHTLAQDAKAEEIARAVSVAMAFFEDTLAMAPDVLLSAGPLGAEELGRMLRAQGLAGAGTLQVRELVETGAIAASANVPRGWLAGVRGALKS